MVRQGLKEKIGEALMVVSLKAGFSSETVQMEDYCDAPGDSGDEKRNKRRANSGSDGKTVGEGRTVAKDAHSASQLCWSPVLPQKKGNKE